MRDLLLPDLVAVWCKGELVTLRFGNWQHSLEFHVALQLAAALRYHARIAMFNSGRDLRGFHVLGQFHDANASRPKRKRFIERLPMLLKPHLVGVHTEGALVVLRIKRTSIKFAYECARALSQWLRLRGKEAKCNVGERTHWSKIDQVDAAACGEYLTQ